MLCDPGRSRPSPKQLPLPKCAGSTTTTTSRVVLLREPITSTASGGKTERWRFHDSVLEELTRQAAHALDGHLNPDRQSS
mmetsp:Transcript_71397/g.157899  ORF Transcript_71397/g.157899 Transcript_71397/m.157899 type:complete len:80 (+) Transcript_71397:218-457(+)